MKCWIQQKRTGLPLLAVGHHMPPDIFGSGEQLLTQPTAVLALPLHLLLVAIVCVDMQPQVLLGLTLCAAHQTAKRVALFCLVPGHVECQTGPEDHCKSQKMTILVSVINIE